MSLIEYFLKEVSDELGLSVLFYEFILDTRPFSFGSSSNGSSSSDEIAWRFCNQSFDIDWNGATWYASSVKSTKITQSSEINKDGIQLKFPRTDEFARMFIGSVPEFMVFLNIYRGHLTQDNQEYAVYWKGRIAGAKATEDEIEITCESIFTSLKRYGLRARYLRTCRHNVYVGGCRLDPANFAQDANVTSYTEYTLSSPDFGLQPDGYWVGGMIQALDGGLRFIVDHSGSTITLWRPSQTIIDEIDDFGSADIVIYPGCDKSIDDCNDKFGNILNFGGFYLLPTRNPFDGRSIV